MSAETDQQPAKFRLALLIYTHVHVHAKAEAEAEADIHAEAMREICKKVGYFSRQIISFVFGH